MHNNINLRKQREGLSVDGCQSVGMVLVAGSSVHRGQIIGCQLFPYSMVL